MNLVVLAGGTSTEREVSIVSGTGVCKALRAKGHQAILVDVFCGDSEADSDNFFPETYDVDAVSARISSYNDKIESMKAVRRQFFGPNVIEMCQQADFVFLALHGVPGEDGRIQAAFDMLGIQYTGAGYLSSAIAMDKTMTKNLFMSNGVPMAKGYPISREKTLIYPAEKECKYPVIVKPACGGSSVGCTIVKDDAEYKAACDVAFSLGEKAVVEEVIVGREFSVLVIAGKAYPVIEIAPKEGWYDYKNKYVPGATVETCPAQITEEQTKRMQRHAEHAVDLLGITSYARVDFIMNEAGEMYALEANTLPGMTPNSLIPQEAAQEGISYEDLCELLINVSKK